MRAWQFDSAAQRLQPIEAALPTPAAGEVLVRVVAAGVTPTELIWYPSSHNKDGSTRSLAIPGHEFSGTVSALGAGVTDFQVGDAVFGMNDWFADGATAEFCITQPSAIVRKPESLPDAEAAITPIGALTAWQALIDRAGLRAGQRVLIHGGSGSVGSFAVQLAQQIGAKIATTASPRNLNSSSNSARPR